MKDAQKPDHISLTTLVDRLKEGRFVIPDFQREFEWEPWDIAALMRSIFLDYYIGSLLLWRGKRENFEALACEPIYAYRGESRAEYIVLDGQQRLTAMYYTFMAPDMPAPRRANRFRYFIRVDKFMEEAYDDAFIYDWTQRSENLATDPVRQFESHMFPMAVIGAGGWAFYDWVRNYEEYWKAKRDELGTSGDASVVHQASLHYNNAKSFGKHVKDISEKYQIAYIELDRDLELDKVCDIFTHVTQ